jgi:hypothetical protein
VSLGQNSYSAAPLGPLSYINTSNSTLSVEGRILAANIAQPNVKTDANANSIVLLLTFWNVNIFLMGDATTLTEQFILNNDAAIGLSALLKNRDSVLKAGHHGSDTSTGQPWLNKLNPQVVFASSDTRTFSGTSIPSKAVMDSVMSHGSLYDLGTGSSHYYVDYNPTSEQHEQTATTRALCTTLHLLAFATPTTFTAYGTSWYYTVSLQQSYGSWNRNVFIMPSVGWPEINTAY